MDYRAFVHRHCSLQQLIFYQQALRSSLASALHEAGPRGPVLLAAVPRAMRVRRPGACLPAATESDDADAAHQTSRRAESFALWRMFVIARMPAMFSLWPAAATIAPDSPADARTLQHRQHPTACKHESLHVLLLTDAAPSPPYPASPQLLRTFELNNDRWCTSKDHALTAADLGQALLDEACMSFRGMLRQLVAATGTAGKRLTSEAYNRPAPAPRTKTLATR